MKEKVNNKIIYIIISIGIILILLGIGIGVFANPLSKLFTKSNQISNSIIRILEIQPGDKFKLGQNGPGLNIAKNVDGKDIIIDQIPMPEFIGKIEEINGYYDIVVIGRNESNLGGNTKAYSQINDIGTEYTGTGRSTKANGNYVENDITKRKADEIIDFIKTGQLVYIDKDIVNSESNITKSILYEKFSSKNLELENYKNFISDQDVESITLTTIIQKYQEIKSKRPFISTEIIGGDNKASIDSPLSGNNEVQGKPENRTLEFTMNIPKDTGVVDVNLYLDMNGDGLYKDKERFVNNKSILADGQYKFSYEVGYDFVGLLDWKLEVVKSNGVKSYLKDNVYFKAIDGNKKQIKVLHIYPGNNNNNLDMIVESELTSLNDHNIIITKITNTEFNNTAGKTLKLNGNYNMVIMGFADMYGAEGNSRNQINSPDAIKELKEFIKSGQSVMFTHDTIPFNAPDGSIELTKNFRDYVGQSRFIDIYRKDINTNKYDELDIYKDYDVEKGEYKDRNIPHYTLAYENILGYNLNVGDSMKYSNYIYKTNGALITDYPYEIGNIKVSKTHNQWFQLNLEDPDVVPWYTLSENQNKYDVRNSYYTYSKGNLTYSGAGHSGNNPYNSDERYTSDELKLLVNTIVKAERGANHAPTVNTNIDNNEYIENNTTQNPKEISATSNSFEFTATPKDIDNDIVNIEISIEDKDGNWVSLEKKEKIKQGSIIRTDIPKQYYENRVGEIIKIKVYVKDIQGAEVTKTYAIKPVLDPIVTYTTIDGKGLVGDIIKFTISLKKENEKNNEISDVSIKVKSKEIVNNKEVDAYNKNVIKDLDETEKNIIFDETKSASQSYTLRTEGPITEQIKIELKYKVKAEKINASDPDTYIDKTDEITVNISSLRGEIKLKTVDKIGNILPQFEGTSSLQGENGFSSQVSIYGLQGGVYTWPDYSKTDITSSNYTLSLATKTELTNFKIIGHQIKDSDGSIINSDKSITEKIPINYDNPKVEITFIIERDKPIDTSNNKQLKILEIQPGNKFILTRNETKDEIIPGGREIIKISDNQLGNIPYMEELIIDHISMPEFIGKIDQLNGYYDAIVIGRNTDDIENNYKDYSQIDYGSNEESAYQENDITNRKADEIIDFISKSQIVYIDKQIFKEDINNSNLVKKFKEFNNTNSNVNIYENNQAISLDNIINKYTINKENKKTRPLISVESPIGDESNPLWEEGETPNENDDILGTLENRNLKFKVNMLQESKENSIYSVKLYLDINGDGIYNEDNEKVKVYANQTIPNDGFEIDYNLSENFIGQLNWKVELERDDRVKSYLTGKMNFRRLEGKQKRQINILQIMPDNTNLDLSQEKNEFNRQLERVKDYDVKVETTSISKFNDNTEYIASNLYKYDMIVLGFKSGNKDITNESINKLTEFVTENKKGIIFTNDTIMDNTDLTNKFKNYIGQERFSNLSIKGETIYKNTVSSNIIQQTNEGLITNYPYNLTSEKVDSKESSSNIVQLSPNKLNIKETNTQYFQLDFEDEEVVPWYNIKGNNNEFDSRNSYYTYSKDNVVFSSIGKDKDGQYGESEMKLLVNSLIKTERGSNHSPDIMTTIPEKIYESYDYEIPYNEDYRFKVSVDDIDDDNITSLKVSYKIINGNSNDSNWIHDNRYSFTNVNKKEFKDIILEKTIWNSKEGNISTMTNILQIKVEAIDEHNAKSEKVYTILPTNQPLLEATSQDITGLVGDNINSTIELTVKNNIGTYSISNITVREIDKQYKDLFKQLNLAVDNNILNLNLESMNPIRLNQVPIIVDYKVTNGTISIEKVLQIFINIDIKKGEVELNIISENDEELESVLKATLISSKINSQVNIDSNYIWSIDTNTVVATDNYSIELNNLNDLDAEIIEYKINDIKHDEAKFNISYSNPKVIVTIKLSLGENGKITNHGIYSQRGDSYTIGSESQNIIKGMYYTIGLEANIGRNNSILEVIIPNTGNLDTNIIQFFEVNEDGTLDDLTLIYISNENITISDNNIVIRNLLKDKKYLLVYNSKFDGDTTINGYLKYKENIESKKDFNINLDIITDPENPQNTIHDIPELF